MFILIARQPRRKPQEMRSLLDSRDDTGYCILPIRPKHEKK